MRACARELFANSEEILNFAITRLDAIGVADSVMAIICLGAAIARAKCEGFRPPFQWERVQLARSANTLVQKDPAIANGFCDTIESLNR